MKKAKKYQEPINEEMETTINVLYEERIVSIYTNKVQMQKKLNKLIGEPKKEHKRNGKITGSFWDISLDDKAKIGKVILKVDIFECIVGN